MTIIGPFSNVQYRPVSTWETAADSPMSVRVFADLSVAVNNYKHYVGNPSRGIVCFPHWESRDATTTEHVITQFCPMRIPDGYNKVQWDVHAWLSAGAGNVELYLYQPQWVYADDGASFQLTEFTGDRTPFCMVTVNQAGAKWYTNTTTEVDPDPRSGYIFFCLTAKASDLATRAKISGMKITAGIQ